MIGDSLDLRSDPVFAAVEHLSARGAQYRIAFEGDVELLQHEAFRILYVEHL